MVNEIGTGITEDLPLLPMRPECIERNSDRTPTQEQFGAYDLMARYLWTALFGGDMPPVILNFSRKDLRCLGFFAPSRWSKRRRPAPGTHESQIQLILTQEETLCAQARSEYLGWRASLRQDVQRFRDIYLGNAILTREQIGVLIASEAVRKLPLPVFEARGISLVGHQTSGVSELLERFNTPWEQQFLQWHGETHWMRTFPVWPGSIADDLRVLAAELSGSYDWHEVQAVEFILSTAVPLVLSMRASFRMVNREEHAYTRIILECDVREDAERVRQRFLGMQRRLLGRDNFPPKERTIRVFRFVVGQWQEDSNLKFPELRRRWNAEVNP